MKTRFLLRAILPLLILLLYQINLFSYTTVGGNASGTWTAGTFLVSDNIKLQSGVILTNETGYVMNPTTPSIYLALGTPLAGDYTVGIGCNYSTITAAIADLNSSGVSAPVRFLLNDATYPTETYPITVEIAKDFPTATNTVTIKPNTGVTASISGSSTTSIFKLNGADYIIIDGSNTISGTTKDLTITNTNTGSSSVIQIVSLGAGAGAINNTIKSCIISSGSSGVASYGISIGGNTFGTSGADNDNVTIQNNTISGISVGIYSYGTASVTSGGNDNLLINQNTITVNTNTTSTNFGIRVGYGLNSTISNNTVSVYSIASGHPVGISLETGFVSSSISKNTISQVITTSDASYGGRGLTVGTETANSNLIISNNIIYGVNGSNSGGFTNSSSFGIGLGIIGNGGTFATTTGGVSFYYNSVNLYGNYSNSNSCVTAALVIGYYVTGLDIRNNIFSNSLNNTSGTGSISYSVYSYTENNLGLTTINYNNYYPLTPAGANTNGLVGHISSINRPDIEAWKTGTGQDANSVSGNPGFTSETNLQPDINNNNCWNLNSGAYPLETITTDILGAIRSTTLAGGASDIGAYEFTPDISTAAPINVSGVPSTITPTTITFAGITISTITWHAALEATLPNSITVIYKPGVNPSNTPEGSKFANKIIEVTADGGSGYTYDISLKYNLSRQGTITSESKFRAAKYTGSSWVQYSTLPDQTAKTITVTGLNSFSTFTFSDNDFPLPVTLEYFNSYLNGRDVRLYWKTSSEINNAGFELERAAADMNSPVYIKVGFINGHGTTSTGYIYTFEDKKLNSGKYNYRLKQIDYNGNYEYHNLTNTVEVGLPAKFELSQNYPNPFNPVTKIDYTLPFDGFATIIIFDITGREIKTIVNEIKQAGYYTIEFNTNGIASGTYFYSLKAKDFYQVKKMVVLK